ncbi:MAG: hypothetical protein R2764_03920 [Bacteroidales bacterium]
MPECNKLPGGSVPGFVGCEKQRDNYIREYCRSESKNWSTCKRLIRKKYIELLSGFCHA